MNKNDEIIALFKTYQRTAFRHACNICRRERHCIALNIRVRGARRRCKAALSASDWAWVEPYVAALQSYQKAALRTVYRQAYHDSIDLLAMTDLLKEEAFR